VKFTLKVITDINHDVISTMHFDDEKYLIIYLEINNRYYKNIWEITDENGIQYEERICIFPINVKNPNAN